MFFKEHIGRCELPSVRAIKQQARAGTDRARILRDQLAEVLQETAEAA